MWEHPQGILPAIRFGNATISSLSLDHEPGSVAVITTTLVMTDLQETVEAHAGDALCAFFCPLAQKILHLPKQSWVESDGNNVLCSVTRHYHGKQHGYGIRVLQRSDDVRANLLLDGHELADDL